MRSSCPLILVWKRFIRRFQSRLSQRKVLRSGILLVPRHCREKMPSRLVAPCLPDSGGFALVLEIESDYAAMAACLISGVVAALPPSSHPNMLISLTLKLVCAA